MSSYSSSEADKKQSVVVLKPSWLIPMDCDVRLPDNPLATRWLEHHAVVIEGEKIKNIISINEVALLYPNSEVIELNGMALLPGLINAHTHASMNLLKGYSDDLSLHDWLETAIWPIEAKFVDDDFVFQGTQLAIAEMLRGGTTCFQDMYFMPDQIAKAVQKSGIRANIGLMVVDNETVWARDADECINKGLAVFDRYKHDDKLSFSFAPHAPYTVSKETLTRLNTLSFELSLNIHMHLHETKIETEQYQQIHGVRPLGQLNLIGLLNPQLNAVHMTDLNEEEIEWLTQTGTHVIHCPQSNMKLASGICPTSRLLQLGVNVAIGTDGSASNNDLDMLSETQTAALLAKANTLDPEALPAFQALYCATMGGAKALGLDNEVGSIEIGKQADLIAIDLNQIETLPVYNPISQIVYSASRNQVEHVWVSGKQLLKNRQLTTIDIKSVMKHAHAWKTKIKGDKND
jgi:5-methylthioadenosine/S-adenosylhomocysteine deaminase